jgi:flagellar basal-body rod modification protein FlgD
MVSQLASVSQVGQAVQTNTMLASLLTATSLSQAEQLIGKNIESSDGTVAGQVSTVNVGSNGIVATLSDGRQVTLGAGVTIGG